MATTSKTPRKTAKRTAGGHGDKVVVQARIDADLAKRVQQMAKESGDESVSVFFRRALETEASRETLCKPTAEVTIADVAKKLGQMHDLLAAQNAQIKVNAALLASVCLAVGVKTEPRVS